MDAFLSGFEDELTKLARVPYTGRPPEISVNQPKGPGSFDWGGFDKKFRAEAAEARRRREFRAKGGHGLQAPKKRKWVRVPPPAPKPEKKKGRGRRRKKPKSVTVPEASREPRMTRFQFAPSETPKYEEGVDYQVQRRKWEKERKRRQKRVFRRIQRRYPGWKPPEGLGSAPTTVTPPGHQTRPTTAGPDRMQRIQMAPRERPLQE